ncbi:MAG: hypothetical protein QXV17_03730 [Candidatus Micrarchaeaceae archaeon]
MSEPLNLMMPSIGVRFQNYMLSLSHHSRNYEACYGFFKVRLIGWIEEL